MSRVSERGFVTSRGHVSAAADPRPDPVPSPGPEDVHSTWSVIDSRKTTDRGRAPTESQCGRFDPESRTGSLNPAKISCLCGQPGSLRLPNPLGEYRADVTMHLCDGRPRSVSGSRTDKWRGAVRVAGRLSPAAESRSQLIPLAPRLSSSSSPLPPFPLPNPPVPPSHSQIELRSNEARPLAVSERRHG